MPEWFDAFPYYMKLAYGAGLLFVVFIMVNYYWPHRRIQSFYAFSRRWMRIRFLFAMELRSWATALWSALQSRQRFDHPYEYNVRVCAEFLRKQLRKAALPKRLARNLVVRGAFYGTLLNRLEGRYRMVHRPTLLFFVYVPEGGLGVTNEALEVLCFDICRLMRHENGAGAGFYMDVVVTRAPLLSAHALRSAARNAAVAFRRTVRRIRTAEAKPAAPAAAAPEMTLAVPAAVAAPEPLPQAPFRTAVPASLLRARSTAPERAPLTRKKPSIADPADREFFLDFLREGKLVRVMTESSPLKRLIRRLRLIPKGLEDDVWYNEVAPAAAAEYHEEPVPPPGITPRGTWLALDIDLLYQNLEQELQPQPPAAPETKEVASCDAQPGS